MIMSPQLPTIHIQRDIFFSTVATVVGFENLAVISDVIERICTNFYELKNIVKFAYFYEF